MLQETGTSFILKRDYLHVIKEPQAPTLSVVWSGKISCVHCSTDLMEHWMNFLNEWPHFCANAGTLLSFICRFGINCRLVFKTLLRFLLSLWKLIDLKKSYNAFLVCNLVTWYLIIHYIQCLCKIPGIL